MDGADESVSVCWSSGDIIKRPLVESDQPLIGLYIVSLLTTRSGSNEFGYFPIIHNSLLLVT